MSWVMVIVVAPSSLETEMISSLMTSAMIGSRPVVGSSKKMISGLAAIALARAALFCIPPDSSDGNRLAVRSSRPTDLSFWMAIALARFLEIFFW